MRKSISVVVGVLVMTALSEAHAAWCGVPLEQWTEARTLDSCTEAARLEGLPETLPSHGRCPVPVPEPPYGRWREQDGVVQAVGLTHCWSTMLMPGERAGAEISTRFTVRTSSGAARQLPGGCVRWGFHWGENLPGWDVGVVLGYRDPLNFYRVQLSAARGELALWDATGAFLQLIPCAVEVGKPHDLNIRWRAGHLVAELDGKIVMDYWDRTLPYATGRVGMAVWKSDVRIERFDVAEAGGGDETVPSHKPAFRFEPSGGLLEGHPGFSIAPYEGVILFDGNEPISCFFKFPPAKGKLYHAAVKLKPGWRPAYYNYIGPRLNIGVGWPSLAGELPGAFKVNQTGESLAFTFRMNDREAGHTDYDCIVGYDERRGVYRYEYRGRLHNTNAANENTFELADPLTYNNRAPGPEVVHRWNPAGHRWWVFQGDSDAWQRFPMADDWRENLTLTMKWGKAVDFLYPDPAACPAFEVDLGWPQGSGRPYRLNQCLWGYDYHHTAGDATGLKVGDERTWTMTFTALPPTEANALFHKSEIPQKYRELAERPYDPFDPTGTTFRKTTTLADPSTTMCWMGGERDETVGHGDTYSLRIDGPGKARVFLYQYMIEQVAPAWRIRGSIKTQDVDDKGVVLRVKYSYGKQYIPAGVCGEEMFTLSGSGTRDWTAFSVVTSVPQIQDATDIVFELDGEGSAWIDDVAVSALGDGQQLEVTATAEEHKEKGQ